MTPMISIDYDDMSQDSYKGFLLTLADGKPHRFATGDVQADHTAALVTFYTWLAEQGVMIEDGVLMGTSSMDHFGIDGTTYVEREVTLELPQADGQIYEVTMFVYGKAA